MNLYLNLKKRARNLGEISEKLIHWKVGMNHVRDCFKVQGLQRKTKQCPANWG